jgi:hypothetical protein
MNMSKVGVPVTGKYWFSIDAELDHRIVGEVPGGVRIDLGYRNGKVTVKPKLGSDLETYFGIKTTADENAPERTIGEISSGQDWLLIGAAGPSTVADFDGRLTIRFRPRAAQPQSQVGQQQPKAVGYKDQDNGGVSLVVGGRMRGRVDLAIKYAEWFNGHARAEPLPLALPLFVDVARFGPGGTWVEPLPAKQDQPDDDFAKLGRYQLLGVGHATCKNERYSPLERVTFDVYSVTSA